VSGADIAVFLIEFVEVTPGMHNGAWCEKFVAADVTIAEQNLATPY